MLIEAFMKTSVLLIVIGIVMASENYVDYGEDLDKVPAENMNEFYRLLLQRNALENSAFRGIPLEHLMIRKSQRSPSLRLRFGRSGGAASAHSSGSLMSRPLAVMATDLEDNNNNNN